ncbi:MAG: helix-turn-helix transcriptional regulator [Rhodobacteraceae bacterium]|nr:helix-turn-helix transcriptional regulator [Paracoccaceae bacterium]
MFANVETLNAAAWITIFHDEIGDDFHTDLKATLPDPTAMPRDYLDPRSCFKSRDGRSKLSFPCDWLLVELKQEWSVPPSHVDGDLRQRDTTTELDPIRQAIAERLQVGEVKLEEVASWLGQSPRGLQRKLRENGQTLRKIVQQERTNRAAALLRASDMPINEIALMCGYSSAQSLARSFRSAFGLSPSEFRDQPREARSRVIRAMGVVGEAPNQSIGLSVILAELLAYADFASALTVYLMSLQFFACALVQESYTNLR